MCEENNIMEPNKAKTFKKTIQDRLVDYYIQLPANEFVIVTQKGSVNVSIDTNVYYNCSVL